MDKVTIDGAECEGVHVDTPCIPKLWAARGRSPSAAAKIF